MIRGSSFFSSARRRAGVSTPWLNHALVPVNSGPALGTQYNFGFTPTSGSLLVVIGASQTTWTTPAGWTAQASLVGGTGSYLYTKTSNGTETSFTTDHNGTGNAAYPGFVEVFEFAAGLTLKAFSSGALANAATDTMPALGSLTGTNTIIYSAQYSSVAASGIVATLSVGTALSSSQLVGTSDGTSIVTTYLQAFAGATATANTSGRSAGGGAGAGFVLAVG